jgi:signal transduction protein with GAF and PtsI domain
MVKVEQYTGKIIAKDFPKIIINTNQEELEILYSTDEERDKALIEIKQTIAEYTSEAKNMEKQSSINISVSKSSNVNIVSQSSGVKINQEFKEEVNSKISELFEKLESIQDIEEELKADIIDCLNDIKSNVDNDKKVPKYSLKGLVDLTSKIASLSSLGIGIAQLFGA